MSSLGPVTTENWEVPPHNRWSFQHVQELFPTCRLARDPSAAFVLPTKPQGILQLKLRSCRRYEQRRYANSSLRRAATHFSPCTTVVSLLNTTSTG